MARTEPRRRRRWRRSAALSVALHALLIGFLLTGRPPPKLSGRLGPLNAVISVEIAEAATHAAPPPPRQGYLGPMLRRRPEPIVMHRRSRPAVTLSSAARAIEPPPFQPTSEGGGSAAAPARPATPPAPAWLSTTAASYLRTYDFFPGAPSSLSRQRAPYVVLARVCVAPDGRVNDVVIEQGAERALDGLLARAMRTWRYRPLVLNGEARAFCHPIRVKYEVP
jgi:hypothetical protein